MAKTLDQPILYTFRRCPYAIRARFALEYAKITYLPREVSLRDKPSSMLKYSPKGTVPVLILSDGQIIDESIDIMLWALAQNDPGGLTNTQAQSQKKIYALIKENDEVFTKILHRFKYAHSYKKTEHDLNQTHMSEHLEKLEILLSANKFLLTDKPSLADLAIFPFIRQLARINEEDFRARGLLNLTCWLEYFLHHEAFDLAMQKFPLWQDS